jgi:4,4-dimethyl-9beta,19-cyclopropylsterol-4alpha-methyl oxidase
MLPYATTAGAEAALGRALTGAEAAWLRYSASVPDHLLYCHNVAILLVIYTLAPLPLALFELLTPRAVSSPLKLQPRTRLSPAVFLRCYFDTARVLLLTVGMLSIASFPVVKVRFIVHIHAFFT